MAETTADRSGSLVETHKGYNPRVLFFYLIVAALLLTLAIGLAYQQLFKTDIYHERERQQNQRRILVPGPRGNIYDREGRLLVENRARFSVTLHLDELRKEFRREFIRVRKNYRELDDRDIPSAGQMEHIARYAVVQRYLDRVNTALGRKEKVDAADLNRHFNQQLLLPYTLLDDLTPEEYARLIEQLPVRSPLQVYAATARHYPYNSAAAHVLGSVRSNDNVYAPDFPGEELTTFKMKGTVGRDGIEAKFDSILQGQTGGTIYRVDPSGYRVDPALHKRLPKQGTNITTSLDIDLQVTMEKSMAELELAGAGAVIDVQTGEVLALASKPDYDLNDFSPRLTHEKAREIEEKGAWNNRAVNGLYPPGSTFKILVAIAGMRAGWIAPETRTECNGYFAVGKRLFPCHGGHGHGEIEFRDAVAKSCNIFFYQYGIATSPETIAAEGVRFGLDRQTGIELPFETKKTLMPTPAWRESRGERWFPGDTANMSIGQGDVIVTPLQMACFTASLARGQTITKPTLLHQPGRPPQRTASIGLTSEQYHALIEGMERCVHGKGGTANLMTKIFTHPVRIAGKTGTAQQRVVDPKTKKPGTINYGWMICFAPVEKPEIALAVVIEGNEVDEELAGGRYAGPVAAAVLQKYFDKKQAGPKPTSRNVASVSGSR